MANKVFVKVKENTMELMKLAAGLAFIKKMDVLVGIPEETNAGHGAMDNAGLLYLHDNGSPGGMIPARPVLQTGVHDPAFIAQAQSMYRVAFVSALMGNIPGALNTYNAIGMQGANMVKSKFGGIGPPLKPSTIARKGSSATLIDTSQLRNAISFIVRPK